MPTSSINTTTNTNLIPSVGATQGVVVQGLTLLAGASVNLTVGASFVTNKGSTFTALTGPLPLTTTLGLTTGFFPEGWIICPPGTIPAITLNSAVQVSGVVTYQVFGGAVTGTAPSNGITDVN